MSTTTADERKTPRAPPSGFVCLARRIGYSSAPNLSQFGERNAAQFTPAYASRDLRTKGLTLLQWSTWCKAHPTSDRPPLIRTAARLNEVQQSSASGAVSVIKTYLA